MSQQRIITEVPQTVTAKQGTCTIYKPFSTDSKFIVTNGIKLVHPRYSNKIITKSDLSDFTNNEIESLLYTDIGNVLANNNTNNINLYSLTDTSLSLIITINNSTYLKMPATKNEDGTWNTQSRLSFIFSTNNTNGIIVNNLSDIEDFGLLFTPLTITSYNSAISFVSNLAFKLRNEDWQCRPLLIYSNGEYSLSTIYFSSTDNNAERNFTYGISKISSYTDLTN